MYDINYFETFLPVARMNSIMIIFSVAVNLPWLMCQLDVKNAFLYGDLQENLQEKVNMEQPLGYVAQGEIKSVVSEKLYMISSRVQRCGLRSSTLLYLALVFTDVTQITLSLFSTQSLVL